MPSDQNREILARVAARVRQGTNLTQSQARKIVERHIERAQRKKEQ